MIISPTITAKTTTKMKNAGVEIIFINSSNKSGSCRDVSVGLFTFSNCPRYVSESLEILVLLALNVSGNRD